MEFTVEEVHGEPRPWSNGRNVDYRVSGKLSDGTKVERAELTAKPPDQGGKVPKVGETFDCEYDPRPGNNFGPKVKRVSQAGGGGGGGRGWSPKDPTEQARIAKQASIKAAVVLHQRPDGGEMDPQTVLVTARAFFDDIMATNAPKEGAPAQTSPPFGPEYDGDRDAVQAAIVDLVGSNEGHTVFDWIESDCGYLPAKVARAILATRRAMVDQ